jgi:hypothetical protein
MKHQHCPFEEKIAQASRSGQWSDELLAHVSACASCEEVTLVASYLSESNASAAADNQLPDAGRVWFKAQIAAKTAAMERAMRPILWARRFAFGAGALVVVTAIVMMWSQFGALFGNFAASFSRRPSAPAAHDGMLFLGMAAFILVLVPLVFGLYSVWSED